MNVFKFNNRKTDKNFKIRYNKLILKIKNKISSPKYIFAKNVLVHNHSIYFNVEKDLTIIIKQKNNMYLN